MYGTRMRITNIDNELLFLIYSQIDGETYSGMIWNETLCG